MTIDSHHHFWNYSAEEYGWIGDGMDVLKRDFGPNDLLEVTHPAQVDGVISVQARTSLAETDALLKIAKEQSLVKGVVGWVDLTSPEVAKDLESYAGEPLVKGFRHVLQGEPDERFMLRKDFNRGIETLHEFGFVYDILIYHYHLPHTPAFVDQHPGQIFIIDHVAKPRIDSPSPDQSWIQGMKEIAKRENVFCKVSGMITEVVPGMEPSPELLRPYFDVVLDAFGPDRLMFGSDWPVCLLRTSYAGWIGIVRSWIQELSPEEQSAMMGGNAARAYNLEGPQQ